MRATATNCGTGWWRSRKAHGFDLKITGAPSMPYVRITDESLMLHQEWCARMHPARGLFHLPSQLVCFNGPYDDDIAETLEIADEAFQIG